MIRRRLSVLLASCVGLMALADWLFYGQPAGWTFALFFFAAAMLVALKGGAHLRGISGAAAIAAVLGLLAALVIQPGPLVVVMCALSIAVLAILAREPLPQDAAALTVRLMVFALKMPLQWILDARPLRRILQRRQFGPSGKSLLNWTLPVAGSIFFLGLFAVANPLLSLEFDIWSRRLQSFFAGISLSPSRGIFWALTGLCAWALLRVRTLVARRASVQPRPRAMSVARASMLVRCLALFNLIFLGANRHGYDVSFRRTAAPAGNDIRRVRAPRSVPPRGNRAAGSHVRAVRISLRTRHARNLLRTPARAPVDRAEHLPHVFGRVAAPPLHQRLQPHPAPRGRRDLDAAGRARPRVDRAAHRRRALEPLARQPQSCYYRHRTIRVLLRASLQAPLHGTTPATAASCAESARRWTTGT